MKKCFFVTWLMLLVFAVLPAFGTAAEDAMFSYSGRVKVQGQPFSGTGQFKLAIINAPGTTSYWSNDGSSVNGSEPTNHFTANVSDGIVSILVGDTSAGMNPINRTVFNQQGGLKLRVWFSDGVNGFQHLLPDMNLVNVDLLGGNSGTDDFTLYVDAATGDDENDGLSVSTAKKTIQAAVDLLPQRINSNVTVKIMPGVYRETVLIYGIDVRPDKLLTILGDESWTTSSASEPSVRVTGSSNSVTEAIDRENGLRIVNSSFVDVKGILFDYAESGVSVSACTTVRFYNCMFSRCYRGTRVESTTGHFGGCRATENILRPGGDHGYGFWLPNNSAVSMASVISNNNEGEGLVAQTGSFVSINSGNSIFSSNAKGGLWISQLSRVAMIGSATAECQNNTGYGIRTQYVGLFIKIANVTLGGNTLGDTNGDNIF